MQNAPSAAARSSTHFSFFTFHFSFFIPPRLRIPLALLLLSALPCPAPRADAQQPQTVVVEGCLVSVLHQVRVPAREAGVLENMLVQEGNLVQKGQILASLDELEEKLQKQQADFDYQMAKASSDNDVSVRFSQAALKVAMADLAAAEEANRETPGTVTRSELRERTLLADKARLQVEQSQHELQVSRVAAQAKQGLVQVREMHLLRRQILAPLAGLVVEVRRQPGEWVAPGDQVLRILQLERLRVEGFLDARKFGRNLNGKTVTVTATLPGGTAREFPGKIVFVSPEVEPITQQFRFWAEVENRDLHLRPGTTVKTSFQNP